MLTQRRAATTAFVIAVLLTIGLYVPGLSGSYFFDDYPNIVDNPALRLADNSVASWKAAALSSPSSELARPFASLSFAINTSTTALDPFWMKLTNLLLHIANGLLLLVLGRRLLDAARPSPDLRVQNRWIATLAAAGWLLLPINLTVVLYVVQRMESLAQLFVVAGLIGYVIARQRMLRDGRGWVLAIASIVLGTALGILAKETAVLLPLYALVIEALVFGGVDARGRRDRRIWGLFTVLLALPFVAGMVLVVPRMLSEAAWIGRPFTVTERLLTESRVVVDYLRWTLWPTPGSLPFFHDGYIKSSGWLSPVSTLLSTLLLAATAIAALLLRKRAVLFSLGIALFFAAHTLTATILPLELVFEHRNYFASFALLLAVLSVLLDCLHRYRPLVPAIAIGLLFGNWALQTGLTSRAWGEPLRLAHELSLRAPQSPRAQYELGAQLTRQAGDDKDSPYAPLAIAALERAMPLPGSSILAEQALIIFSSRTHLPIDAAWWASLHRKLRSQPIGAQDIDSLARLTRCAISKACDLSAQDMIAAFTVALNKRQTPDLLAIYADYAWNVMEDRDLALRLARDAVDLTPAEPIYRTTLVKMLIASGQADQAEAELNVLVANGGANAVIVQELRGHLAALRRTPVSTPEAR